MANLIAQSPDPITFSKESATEYFLKPMFLESDIRDIVTVRTDIKSREKLNMISALQKITKAYAQGDSFTDSDGVLITQRTIEVSDLKAQVSQNGKAFLDFVMQEGLRKGVDENDISGTIFEQIVIAVYIAGLKADFQRQIFLGQSNKETMTATGSLYSPSGVAEGDYNQYQGFWARVEADFVSSVLPAAQKVDLNVVTTYQTVAAVAAVKTSTITGTSGTANITINGIAYLATFATSLTVTASNFVTAHAATILARDGRCVVTSSGADVIVTSGLPGMNVTVSAPVNVSGDLAGSVATTTAAVRNTTLTVDAAKKAFAAMFKAMTPELRAFQSKGELRYIVTQSMLDNYMESLEGAAGIPAAYQAMIDGVAFYTFRGIPIVARQDWDIWINSADFGYVRPHRGMLTVPKNLVVGTDGSGDDMMIETWYNVDLQKNRTRVEYKVGTQYVHEKFIVAAY